MREQTRQTLQKLFNMPHDQAKSIPTPYQFLLEFKKGNYAESLLHKLSPQLAVQWLANSAHAEDEDWDPMDDEDSEQMDDEDWEETEKLQVEDMLEAVPDEEMMQEEVQDEDPMEIYLHIPEIDRKSRMIQLLRDPPHKPTPHEMILSEKTPRRCWMNPSAIFRNIFPHKMLKSGKLRIVKNSVGMEFLGKMMGDLAL
ncbi:hypothetical protein DM02DRAFT_697207 [Periconia macrospinosa]|uniref:Uncharacterized protein n=1 Tax=Periconia macrospinosa TaxID=97972 RepID=A0A2V1D5B8_9PLEO|nr:hypothetical protein DM02DRAFT_697207 [Periconia macrospinosa]